METGEFVVPGIELGYSEEFMPGNGTYEENGRIYASMAGILQKDMRDRKISVTPKTNVPPMLKVGDVVVGTVADIKPQLALVDIVRLKGNERSIPGSTEGGIHISQIKDSYVRDIPAEFSVGDIILAKVVSVDVNSMRLSTVDKSMGVIKAFCGHCNIPLSKTGNTLKCKNCGRIEYRKISLDYGKAEV